jgi:hypothetical protein
LNERTVKKSRRMDLRLYVLVLVFIYIGVFCGPFLHVTLVSFYLWSVIRNG